MARARATAPSDPLPGVTTLKKRAEFLRVRKGARCAMPAFVLEAKGRSDGEQGDGEASPRFGFTVTRKIGKAVERNRIKRRLKAAVRSAVAAHAESNFDYVLIARRPALTTEFATLTADLVKALGRVHRTPARGRPDLVADDKKAP